MPLWLSRRSVFLALAVLTGRAEADSRTPVSPEAAQKLIGDRAHRLMTLLQAADWEGVVPFVHPVKGVCFGPYNGPCEKGLSAGKLAEIWGSGTELTWGRYDGSGKPIRLSFKAYYRRFICDRDFAGSKSVLYDVYVHRGGDNYNVLDDHPKDVVVDFHVPSTGAERNDWRSLRLIFEEKDNSWYLVAVVHDEWTI
jgi:hypothetical protein